MIHSGWAYVEAAYGVTLTGLAVLAIVVAARLRHWARQARTLEDNGASSTKNGAAS